VWDAATGREVLTLSEQTLALPVIVATTVGLMTGPFGQGPIHSAGALLLGRRYTFEVYGVAFSPDGRFLAAATGEKNSGGGRLGDGGVKVWHLQNRQVVRRLAGPRFLAVSVAFSPDGSRLAASGGAFYGGMPGEIKVWETATGNKLFDLQASRGCILQVAF